MQHIFFQLAHAYSGVYQMPPVFTRHVAIASKAQCVHFLMLENVIFPLYDGIISKALMNSRSYGNTFNCQRGAPSATCISATKFCWEKCIPYLQP